MSGLEGCGAEPRSLSMGPIEKPRNGKGPLKTRRSASGKAPATSNLSSQPSTAPGAIFWYEEAGVLTPEALDYLRRMNRR